MILTVTVFTVDSVTVPCSGRFMAELWPSPLLLNTALLPTFGIGICDTDYWDLRITKN